MTENSGSQSGGGGGQPEGYSPLLARLLEETMRDAEKEKQDLDEKIREEEESVRRQREEEAIARREEIQRKVEEEKARRMAQIEAAQAKRGVPANPQTDGGTGSESVPAPEGAPSEKAGGSTLVPWVLTLLFAAAAGGIFFSYSNDLKAADGRMDALSAKASSFQTTLEGALPEGTLTPAQQSSPEATMEALGAAINALIVEEAQQRKQAVVGGEQAGALKKEVAELKETVQALQSELDALNTAKTELEVQLEAASKGKKFKPKKAKSKKKAAPAKVKINTDIFNPNAR